jgi:hypothetical protein
MRVDSFDKGPNDNALASRKAENPVLCTSSVPKLILGPDPPLQFLLRLVH